MIDEHSIGKIFAKFGIPYDQSVLTKLERLKYGYIEEKAATSGTPRERRRPLERTKSAFEKAVAEFNQIDPVAQSQASGFYREMVLTVRYIPSDAPTLKNDLAAVERLISALDAVIDDRRYNSPGRPSEKARNQLIAGLSEILFQQVGEVLRYSDKGKGFVGSDFITALAKEFDPDLTDTDCRAGITAAARGRAR
jgi:hypothetical protein